MIPPIGPNGVFPLLQRQYENLKRGDKQLADMRKLHELEYNTQCGSHESTTQNGPQKTDFLFPILSQHSLNSQHKHVTFGIPVEYKHTSKNSERRFPNQ
jgi:hypothetical protein